MTIITRRHALALTTGAAISACGGGGGGASGPDMPPPPPPPPPAGLSPIRTAAAAKNMRFGTAINFGTTFADNRYLDIVRTHCNAMVPENDMKWQALRPSGTTFDFVNADALANFSNNALLAHRFHTLLWEDEVRYPQWLRDYDFGPNPALEAERLLTEHIRTCCRRYRDFMVSWDVVNEAVDPATGAYRSSPFSRVLGMENVLDIAFNTARQELPGAELVYNDFMSWNGTTSAHRDGVITLLERLKARGTPINALGVQAHVWGGNATGFFAEETPWRQFLDRVTGLGLGLVITEFDVDDRDLPASIAGRDQRIADVTRAYLNIAFAYPQLRDVLVWGLVHRYSWLQTFNPRTDGVSKRPVPFDDAYQPTLMAEEIRRAFELAAARPAA